jgi:hypothetical protein
MPVHESGATAASTISVVGRGSQAAAVFGEGLRGARLSLAR